MHEVSHLQKMYTYEVVGWGQRLVRNWLRAHLYSLLSCGSSEPFTSNKMAILIHIVVVCILATMFMFTL